MNGVQFEVSVDSCEGALIAERNGADRVELCANPAVGGVTPSIGAVEVALRELDIPLVVLVRPRPGNFTYSRTELAVIKSDIGALRKLGVAGVASGCLTKDNHVDVAQAAELVAHAKPMDFVFHRAFDLVDNAATALDQLIAAGVARVLTSGQRTTAIDGAATMRQLQERAAAILKIVGCGSIRPDSVAAVCRTAGLRQYHFAAYSDAHATDSSVAEPNSVRAALGVGWARPRRTDGWMVRETIRLGRGAAV